MQVNIDIFRGKPARRWDRTHHWTASFKNLRLVIQVFEKHKPAETPWD